MASREPSGGREREPGVFREQDAGRLEPSCSGPARRGQGEAPTRPQPPLAWCAWCAHTLPMRFRRFRLRGFAGVCGGFSSTCPGKQREKEGLVFFLGTGFRNPRRPPQTPAASLAGYSDVGASSSGSSPLQAGGRRPASDPHPLVNLRPLGELWWSRIVTPSASPGWVVREATQPGPLAPRDEPTTREEDDANPREFWPRARSRFQQPPR